MRIEIWSDVVCPWCYVGKRRLERALADFEHAAEVEVVYRSFELDPHAPRQVTEPMAEVLARKYGGGIEGARRMMARITQVASEEGLELDLERTLPGNTDDAHRLLHLALEEGGPTLQGALKEELLATYFTRAEHVADPDVLRKAATAVGLDQQRVDAVLGSQEFAEAVAADQAQARAYGVSGVPFFVMDSRYGVSGAQPVEVFAEVLRRAWNARPRLDLVGEADTACSPDGCAV